MIAFITGVTGQDGAYLSNFLLEKGYEVHGMIRRSSTITTERIKPILSHKNFHIHYGDLADFGGVSALIKKINPDEVYNLAAQSHVDVSFKQPEYTADITGVGTLRMLEALRLNGKKNCKFYQASSSELYGLIQENIQDEKTPFYPRSPYAVAKLYSYWITVNYREAYGMYTCNGILFNHESPLRGEEFVTRKITLGLSKIALDMEKSLKIGNLSAKRDWGHAKDYVRMQWMMLQQSKPQDFVIATGIQYSVKDFINFAALELGIKLNWIGEGINEKGIISENFGNYFKHKKIGDVIVLVDEKFFRPAEVQSLLGNSSKAEKVLGWKPTISFDEMVAEMVKSDLNKLKNKL